MTAFFTTLFLLVLPAQPATAPDAVRVAEAAFEYRDFEKVVELIDPWVHPPRITDEKLMVKARSLLGVSRHVLGEVPRAREEFAQLLLADPEHQLDAFKIPPQVIETFEQVRREMKAVLEPLIKEKNNKPPEDPPLSARVLIDVPPRWTMLMPFGAPQFALDQPILGLFLGGTQLIGWTLNLISFFIARSERNDLSTYDSMKIPFYSGIGLALASWGTSIVLGNVDYDTYRRDLLAPPVDLGAPATFSVTFPLSF